MEQEMKEEDLKIEEEESTQKFSSLGDVYMKTHVKY